MAEPLGILLISGGHERAHYAFVLAVGAAAIGRRVCMFATNAGCHALLQDWSGLDEAARDAAVRMGGVAGLDELREAAEELGVALLACDAGLRMAGLESAPLWRGVEVAGVPAFLSATAGGQIITL
jgi:peroxiredoxin family protein